MAGKKKIPAGTGRKEPEEKPAPPREKAPFDTKDAAILTVAFFAGAVLMTLEIVGGRIVATRFGSHVFVWGGLIGIFMGALSLGYFLGGRLADRFPRFSFLGVIMILAGGTVLLVPIVGSPVCSLIGDISFARNVEMANRWNPTLAIILIFSVPSLLLGSISPFAVRLLVREIGTIGRVAARVYAVNAMGSILGTILTAFFLMGVLGNTMILIIAGVLFSLMGASVAIAGWIRRNSSHQLWNSGNQES